MEFYSVNLEFGTFGKSQSLNDIKKSENWSSMLKLLLELIAADLILMYWVSLKTCTNFQKEALLIHDFTIADRLPFLVTGKIWRKSPPKIIVLLPKGIFLRF